MLLVVLEDKVISSYNELIHGDWWLTKCESRKIRGNFSLECFCCRFYLFHMIWNVLLLASPILKVTIIVWNQEDKFVFIFFFKSTPAANQTEGPPTMLPKEKLTNLKSTPQGKGGASEGKSDSPAGGKFAHKYLNFCSIIFLFTCRIYSNSKPNKCLTHLGRWDLDTQIHW